MEVLSFDVNWVAVLALGVIAMVMGFAWYSQALFGKTWMKLLKFKKEDLNPEPTTYLMSFLAAVVSAFLVANLVRALALTDPVDGAVVGVMVGLVLQGAFAQTFLYEKQSLKLALIDGLYYLTYLAIAGALLTAWV